MNLKNKRHVTMVDIAERLGISASTVSRALRDHPDISPETKKKVKALTEELDYFPDLIAQSLQKKSTKTIGVIVPEIRHYFFSSVISGIEEVASALGYIIILCQSNEDFEREVSNMRALMSYRIAGVLVSVSQATKTNDHFKLLQRQGIPLVFFDRVDRSLEVSKVIVDDFDGAYKAVEHLILSGHKHIAHLAGPQYLSISQDRLGGYIAAHKAYNLPVNKGLIIEGGFNEEDGVKGFQRLLELEKLPDAIFGMNDPVIIGAYRKIKEMGLRIPDDIGLVGFSDNLISSFLDPPLTTVAQPGYEMGQMAMRILLDEIEHPQASFKPVIEQLKTKLIIRGSTKSRKGIS